jgi:hypothetical protein
MEALSLSEHLIKAKTPWMNNGYDDSGLIYTRGASINEIKVGCER